MNRIYERFKSKVALVPVSLAASTDSTPIYQDCADFESVDFIISHGALASGKKITVAVYRADDASGTNATKLKEEVFTASASMTSGVLVASADVAGDTESPTDTSNAKLNLCIYAIAAHWYDKRSFEADGFIQEQATKMRRELMYRKEEEEESNE